MKSNQLQVWLFQFPLSPSRISLSGGLVCLVSPCQVFRYLISSGLSGDPVFVAIGHDVRSTRGLSFRPKLICLRSGLFEVRFSDVNQTSYLGWSIWGMIYQWCSLWLVVWDLVSSLTYSKISSSEDWFAAVLHNASVLLHNDLYVMTTQ